MATYPEIAPVSFHVRIGNKYVRYTVDEGTSLCRLLDSPSFFQWMAAEWPQINLRALTRVTWDGKVIMDGDVLTIDPDANTVELETGVMDVHELAELVRKLYGKAMEEDLKAMDVHLSPQHKERYNDMKELRDQLHKLIGPA